MPRSRKQPEPETPAALPSEAKSLDQIEADLCRELGITERSGTAAYYGQMLRILDLKMLASVGPGSKLPSGYNSAKQGFLATAKFHGLSERSVLDQRSDGDKALDAADRLIDSQGDSVFEELDDTIDALEGAMKAAVEGNAKILESEKEKADEVRGRAEAGKLWLRRLERVRRLREMARNPYPSETWTGDGYWKKAGHAWESSHPARFMVYVGRSDLPGKRKPDQVFDIAPHHCKVFVDIWKARNRVYCYPKGAKDHPQGGHKRGATKCRGIFILMPPRHGKTALATFTNALWICQNPKLQYLINHAVDDQVEKNMGYIKAIFDRREAVGRRAMSLFPFELAKKDNHSSKMRLRLPERTRNATIESAGVNGSVGGSGVTNQWWDDPVDKREAEQPNERERKFARLTQVWLPRMMGDDSFLMVTATLWHEDDAVARLVQQSMADKSDYAVSIQSVGGPKTTPKFRSIWKKYPPERLKQLYNDMQDPAGWAAQYMVNPRPEELRMVKRLKFYLAGVGNCPNPKPEYLALIKRHKDFLASFATQFHVTVDPTATSDEKADKAGILWGAIGDLLEVEKKEGHTLERRTRRIRILDGEQIHADQVDLVEHIGTRAAQWRIDRIHVETVAGFAATAQMLTARFGLSSDQVICHHTQNKNKGQRLKAVSAMLDDALRDQGLPGAVVEFPAELNEAGEVVPAPWIVWLCDQVLKYPTAEKGGLDALTQLCKHLQGECQAGEGEVSTLIMDAYQNRNGRPARFAERDRLRKIQHGRRTPLHREETAWMNN